MIIAIGTDIVEIARIAKVLERQAERFCGAYSLPQRT